MQNLRIIEFIDGKRIISKEEDHTSQIPCTIYSLEDGTTRKHARGEALIIEQRLERIIYC